MKHPSNTKQHHENSNLNERQLWALEELRSGTLRRIDIEQRFQVSGATARADLSRMCRSGLIEFHDKPAPGHYRLAR